MHISRVDLNLFVVLDAIYTEGGITRAAQVLNLTQPAVSHALGRLRSLMGDPLFERKGRQMVPTPLARNIITPVRRALRGLELTLNEAERFDPGSAQRRFVLGSRGVMESAILAPLARHLERQAPRLELAMVRSERRTLESDLAGGQLDAVLDILLPVSPALRHRRVLQDQLVVMLRQGHPLLDGELDLGRYLSAGHILVSARRSGDGMEDVELTRHGLTRQVRLRCQQYFAACRAVAETDFLLTLPRQYAHYVNANFGHALRPFPLPARAMDVYLYWHANVDADPANRWLRDRIVDALGSVESDELDREAPDGESCA